MLKLCQSRTVVKPSFPRVDHAAPFGVFVEVLGAWCGCWVASRLHVCIKTDLT
jgi:hypothetical protein